MITDKQTVIRNMCDDYLPQEDIKHRSKGNTTLSYIEGYTAKSNANRIFGQGCWGYSVTKFEVFECTVKDVPNKDISGATKTQYSVGCYAIVKMWAQVYGANATFEDVGYGSGISYSNMTDAHESAGKEAVTDALKRAMSNLGNQFGLCLYDKDTEAVIPTTSIAAIVLYNKIQALVPKDKADELKANVGHIYGAYGYSKIDDVPSTNRACLSQVISYLWREYMALNEYEVYDLLSKEE